MKLTKSQHKLHEEAMLKLQQSGLTEDDKEFVFQNYHPGATNNLTAGAIHFTPFDMAWDVAVMHGNGSGVIVDACAGIGILTYQHWQLTRHWNEQPRYVCIENNREFVEIGKKLVPEAEWHHGDVFEMLPKLGPFHSGLSNPPYGNIASNKSQTFRSSAHFGVMELLLKHTRHGAIVVIPSGDHSQEDSGGRKQPSALYHKFKELYPEAMITPCSLDMSVYGGFKATNIRVMVCDLSIDGIGNPYLVNKETEERQLDLLAA